MNKTNRTIGMLLLISILIATGCTNKNEKSIKIYGSTTIEPFFRKAISKFNNSKHIRFDITAMGSYAGIDSLIDGKCNIAMSSSEPSESQLLKAESLGVSLKPFLLGYDVIIPVVHPTNKVNNISFDQLIGIYRGAIRNWSHIGGIDTTIDIVDRAPVSGTYEVWHHKLLPMSGSSDSFSIHQSNSSVLAHIAKHENAIGYVSSAYLNHEVKPLHLDGIDITRNDSLLSHYHLKRPLFLYVNENNFDNDLKRLIIFLIIDEDGRKIMSESGYFSNKNSISGNSF